MGLTVVAKIKTGAALLLTVSTLLAGAGLSAFQGLPGPAPAELLKVEPTATSLPPVTLKGNPKGVWFAQFSPAGDLLATGGHSGTVTLWSRTVSPAEVPFRVRGGVFWDAAFAPDDQTFAVGGAKQLLIYDAFSAQIKRVIPFEQTVCTVAYSPDGKYLAAGTGNWNQPELVPQCSFFDVATGQELAKLTGHESRMFRVCFSSDNKTLATSSRDKTIRIWEVPTGKLKSVLTQATASKGMVFLPDGTLAAASYDGTIRYFDVETGKVRKSWNAGMVLASLAVSPDSSLLVAAESAAEGKDAAPLKIWDSATGKERLQLKGHTSRILGVAFTRDGRGVVTAGGSSGKFGEVNYWDLITGQHRATHKTPNQWMEAVTVSHDGKRMLSSSVVGMHLWNFDFTHQERTWNANPNSVNSATFLDKGRLLAIGSWDHTISIWDVRKAGAATAVLRGHKGAIRALAALPDGKTLASSSEDKTIKLWDIASAAPIATFDGNQMKAYSIAVSPDGKTLASGGGDHKTPLPGELILWDIETRKPRLILPPQEHCVMGVAYSPDGSMLAATCRGLVKVFDAKTGEVRVTLPALHSRPVAFSPDGKLLIVGAGRPGNGKVRTFDTATWKERQPLDGHEHNIYSVQASPDSATIASTSEDGTVKLWPTQSPVLPGTIGVNPIVAAPTKETAAPVVVSKLIGTGDPTGQTPQDTEAPPRSLSWKVWLALGITALLAAISALGLWRMHRRGQTRTVVSEVPKQRKHEVASTPAPPSAAPRRRLSPITLTAVGIVAIAALGASLFAAGIFQDTPKIETPQPQGAKEFIRKLEGHKGPIHGLRFTPDGTKLVSGSGWPGNQHNIRVWDVATGAERSKTPAPSQVGNLEISRDGKFAFVGVINRVMVIDIETGAVLKSLPGHQGGVSGVALAADGRHAYSASLDGTVKRWDLIAGLEVGSYKVDGKWARRVFELPDPKRILTGSSTGVLQIWDIDNGAEVKHINAGPIWLSAMALAPDGRHAYIGTNDIAVWNIETGQKVRTMVGHADEVTDINFSPDGKQVISTSFDGTARLWDLARGEPLRELAKHDEFIFNAVFSADGKTIATGGGGKREGKDFKGGADHDIRLWTAPVFEATAGAAPARWHLGWLIVSGLVALTAVVSFTLAIRSLRGATRRLTPVGSPGLQGAPPHPVAFTCDHCGKHLKIKPDMAGKKVKCPQCAQAVLVPSA